jgi:5-methylcytosine-specific restriction endonuclease McrA
MLHENSSESAPHDETRDAHLSKLDWRQAHEALSRLSRRRARLDWQEGRALLDALRSAAHLHLGFATFAEYVERVLGHKRRSTEERLRVAEALEQLPKLNNALRDGAMSWSVARELTRVATTESELAWLEAARGRTARQVEELVEGHRTGDRPDDPYDASLRRHVLRFEVSADTYATFVEAMARLRREVGSPIDDDAALLLLARRTLGGPNEQGRANYQIALTVCEACSRGFQHGRGEPVEVRSKIVEVARCDAQHLGRMASSECRGERPQDSHVGARPPRARQDVPPAVRRLVMTRDGGRCVVPGCRQGVFVDVHHVVARSEGGDHDPDTLVVLCSAHHRAVHRGQLFVEGRISSGLSFRHADGTTYGRVVDARLAGVCEEVFRALCSLGFRESEARRAVERARATVRGDELSVHEMLRRTLAGLAPVNRRDLR